MNLHDLSPKHLYEHLPLLTHTIYNRLWEEAQDDDFEDGNDERYVTGNLRDLWLEDDKAFAVWKAEPTNTEYVIRCSDYDLRDTWPNRAQLLEYATSMRRKGPDDWNWEISEGYCLDGRTSFDRLDRLDGPAEQTTLGQVIAGAYT